MSRARQIIEKVFLERFSKGANKIHFSREDLFSVCTKYGIQPLANMGDGAVYSFRYRTKLPKSILDTQPDGMEWIIEGAGISKYVFRLVPVNRIVPNDSLVTIKIPDSTPEIITAYALSDEQALLAKLRYNRLIDTFLGLTAYSLQNHLRTTVKGVGQIEIDEVYVGVDTKGRQYIIPVQAKGGSDKLSVVQTKQDLMYCAQKFPNLICRAISAQFMENDRIAIFELVIEDDLVRVADERHYRLVTSNQIGPIDLANYRKIAD